MKTAIGLMSGTSMDGIDLALIRTDGKSRVERMAATGFFPYAPSVRKMLQQTLEDAKAIRLRSDRPGILGEAETTVTQLHVDAVNAFLEEQEISAGSVDAIGFHGQTVLHRPQEGLTVQIGDGKRLASETGITTVFDMRANDMEHGGQGAPLVPVYHQALASSIQCGLADLKPVAFVNIGGISNITYVGEELIAFDTGPGNALIDQWVQRNVGISHDQGGMIAAEGAVDQSLLEDYLSDGFFEKPVPKSLDRNDFSLPEQTALSVETVARTLAAVSAEAIFKSVEHLPELPALWIICGGGRHNPHIMTDLEKLAKDRGTKVVTAETAGFDGDAMEAEAWAYLAVRSLAGLELTYPQTTGCKVPITGGSIANVKLL